MQLSFSDMKIKKNVYKLHSKRKRSELLNGALLQSCLSKELSWT